ncbi:MAG: HDOD domain-containing protein [Burkholderiales bacterium]|nr:HDOD domain-containing protein [Burkholderiales bacterium]MDE1928443.1 HDOD domain-containing protein [Burkholderiales bacterium]MDE2158983.1 HDOD domain-containing protein [Burkholderiales bacterium]MDE2501623.1 HDOD domain-containing protein [Burkholderiales bacterium]
MTAPSSTLAAERELADPAADALVRELGVPPRPQVLVDLQREMAHEDPDFTRIARIVATDVALTAAVLRVANSPAYGLARRAETLGQALSMLGLKQIGVMVAGLVLRKALRTDGPQLTRFWDVSAKRSWALSALARGLRGVDVDVAQTYGLFCDVGIPLLMQRYPNYGATLQRCNAEPLLSFTEVEQAEHHTDHALIGALMARSWGVSQTVCLAIRLHHDYAVFREMKLPETVARLIAMGLIAERAIQTYAGMNTSTEWAKGGDAALGALMLADHDVEDWIERLVEGYAAGAA